MITQVVEQIKNQIELSNIYYDKCLQCMEQEDENGLIENLLDKWWLNNGMNRAVINFNQSIPVTPVFGNYDDWKQANDSDYVSIKECSKRISKEDFLDYVIHNYDEDLSDYCKSRISQLSSSLQKQAVDDVQQNANLVFNRLYKLYVKDLVEYLEENYETEL